MRGVDADGRHARGRQHAARDGQVEAEDARRSRRSDRRRRRRWRGPARRSPPTGGGVLVAQALREGELATESKKARGHRRTAGRRFPRRGLWRGWCSIIRADVAHRRRKRAGARPGLRHARLHRASTSSSSCCSRRPAAPSGEDFTYGYSAVPVRDHDGHRPGRAADDHGRRQTVPIPQEPGPSPDLADAADEHVHARRVAAPRRQHALPVDLRRQRRAPHRAHAVPASSTSWPGVIASLAQILVNPDSIIPTLGASGAISGVLGAYLVMFPTNRVTVFLFRFPIRVPAIVAIGMWAAFQFISGIGAPRRSPRRPAAASRTWRTSADSSPAWWRGSCSAPSSASRADRGARRPRRTDDAPADGGGRPVRAGFRLVADRPRARRPRRRLLRAPAPGGASDRSRPASSSTRPTPPIRSAG